MDIFLNTIDFNILHSISTFDHNIYFELIKHKKVLENKICVFYIIDHQSFGKFYRIFIKNYEKEDCLQQMNIVFNCNILNMMKEYIPRFKKVFLYGIELNQPEFLENIFVSGLIIDDLVHLKGQTKKYEDFFVFK